MFGSCGSPLLPTTPWPRVLYFVALYLLFLPCQYSSHPLRSCLRPISVVTLRSGPHSALNIEGAYKYCWFVFKVFLNDLSPCCSLPSLTPLRFTVYPTQLTPYSHGLCTTRYISCLLYNCLMCVAFLSSIRFWAPMGDAVFHNV